MIAFQDKKRKAHDESYLSFMLEKENHLESACHLSSTSKDTGKLKEELSYLKHLLAEKNIELKLREE